MKRTAAGLLVTVVLLALPSLALASGNSTNQGYSSPIQSVKNTGSSRTPTTGGTPSSPSTGTPSSPSNSSPSNVSPTNATQSSVSPASAARATETTNASSTLPFTGLDIGLLAAGGVVLLGAGLAVRRLSADNS